MPKITVYTTKNCPFSKRLRDFLYEGEIPFQEIVADSLDKINELKRISGALVTPVIAVDKGDGTRVIQGFTDECKSILLRLHLSA